MGTTDAAARREARPHILWLFRRGLKIPPHFLAPPGYLSEDTLRRFLLAGVKPPSELTFEELERDGYILVGSAATVRDRLQRDPERSRHRQSSSAAAASATCRTSAPLRSATLFAKHVIPHFRRATAQAEDARRSPRARR